MKFIGIDLAWTYSNCSGICILENQTAEYLEADIFSDDEIIELILKKLPCTVSIDAPLRVKNETGGRPVDSQLMKTRINGSYLKLYAASRSYMMKTYKALRGEDLYLRLKNSGFTACHDIVETFPTGIFLSLFPDLYSYRYKLSSKLPLDNLKHNSEAVINSLKKTGFDFNLDSKEISSKKEYKVFEDKLDSLLCAVNSYYLYNKRCRVWKDDSGFIALPAEGMISE